MATFRCGRFPSGTAYVATEVGIVEFRDGIAEVEDPSTAAALHAVPAVFAVTEDGGAAAPTVRARSSTPRTPAKRAGGGDG